MKKALLILPFLFILTSIQAQNPNESEIDSMLVDIDKASFTSGVLYNRVSSWAHLNTFNDTVRVSIKNNLNRHCWNCTGLPINKSICRYKA